MWEPRAEKGAARAAKKHAAAASCLGQLAAVRLWWGRFLECPTVQRPAAFMEPPGTDAATEGRVGQAWTACNGTHSIGCCRMAI
jgi:hypothetical protein